MTYDPCNPSKTIRHHALGRFKHVRHHGPHHTHPYHHIISNGCPKVSVLDTARFGALPGVATVAKLGPVATAAIVAAGGAAAYQGYEGGYGGGFVGAGGGATGGGVFVCTKYTQHDKRCEHIVQVPEPSSILCLVIWLVVIFLSRKRLASI
jgi:hypothetical protein